MAVILHIESATAVCAVSIADKGRILLEKKAKEERDHARMLTVLIDELMADAGYIYSDLDAIAVSKGPGSYTGLRIGVATAKGLCYALDKPLIAVNTLFSMAFSMKIQLNDEADDQLLFCPMIDARRMEVYTAVYDHQMREIQPASAQILTHDSFLEYRLKKLIFFGDGAVKFQQVISRDLKASFPSGFEPDTSGLASGAHTMYAESRFEDIAYFEPYYLKEFVSPAFKG